MGSTERHCGTQLHIGTGSNSLSDTYNTFILKPTHNKNTQLQVVLGDEEEEVLPIQTSRCKENTLCNTSSVTNKKCQHNTDNLCYVIAPFFFIVVLHRLLSHIIIKPYSLCREQPFTLLSVLVK